MATPLPPIDPEVEKKRAEDDRVAMMEMMKRIEKEGHGVMRYIYLQSVFYVNLERLYKERINREVLMQMLRHVVKIMMTWIPEFQGVIVDIVKEQKHMLPNTQGKFTQNRMPNHIIRWFCYRLPNRCKVIIHEKLRDLGVPTQKPYLPVERTLHHCFGGDQLRVVKWGFERFAVGRYK
ncbi:hypothetical protein R1flu_020421 [Riccia fluitans]|uniref:Uncharacterized protein n=1 Tax=Riccia fluitans TaxID=41844 RepID=A0ABD1ZLP4_9MARC